LAGITTHVLDVTLGRPAQGVRVELYELGSGSERKLVLEVTTNADGRTDKPLVSGEHARSGRFELLFHVGDYFRGQRAELTDPPFLDFVPIRPRRSAGALPRAAPRLPVELLDLSRKLRRRGVGYADVWIFLEGRGFPAKIPLYWVGKAWISLDSLVRIESYQWVTQDIRRNNFRAALPGRTRRQRRSGG
jgi:5-hydroxyisourate hydrolase